MTVNDQYSNSPILALTCGDPAGIGLDITLKSWSERSANNIPPFVLYADANTTMKRAQALNLDVPISRIATPTLARQMFQKSLPIIDIPLPTLSVPASPDRTNAPAIIKSIDQAVADITDGLADGLVTNPISKATLYDAGFTYPGHTEYLAALAQSSATQSGPLKPVMMLASDELRVIPLTIHIPLKEVPEAISKELIIQTAITVHEALQIDFAIPHPRLTVTGLNPHAGESGALGREETEIIAPAIAHLKREGFNVTGPFSADTLFHEKARKTYDAVIAMYHDQALIPIKTLSFECGVNVTLGLPFIRTSPDHGTAFDIAGTGKASPNSLIASLHLAAQISKRRSMAQRLQTR